MKPYRIKPAHHKEFPSPATLELWRLLVEHGELHIYGPTEANSMLALTRRRYAKPTGYGTHRLTLGGLAYWRLRAEGVTWDA